jgi:hypothetical protein
MPSPYRMCQPLNGGITSSKFLQSLVAGAQIVQAFLGQRGRTAVAVIFPIAYSVLNRIESNFGVFLADDTAVQAFRPIDNPSNQVIASIY